MSVKLEKLLALLGDSAWHHSDEVAKTLEIPSTKIQKIVTFLVESDLVEKDAKTDQVKLNRNWKTFILTQEDNDDPETPSKIEAVGTIIIPPKQTIKIQSTRITNLTDASLELEIRVNKKVADIAISKLQSE